jgi:DNA-directed RNA polymerase sigma subunit (sigma70/sigma32)
MTAVSNKTLRQLDALNSWLKDVFGEDIRLSMLLTEAGLTEADSETVKSKHLAAFIQAVVNLIANNTANHDGERRNSVMVRHYGLLDGKPETLQSIGDTLELSRERIRQLVQKRVRLYSNAKHKEQFKADIAGIARWLLNNELPMERDNPQ